MGQNDYSIHAMAVHIGTWAANSSGQPARWPILSYGAEVILGSVIKIAVLAIIAIILGILPIVAVLVFAAGSLRLLAGGAHCTAYYRCLLFSLGTFSTAGILVKTNMLYLTGLSIESTFLPILACLMLNLKWAPLPPENKPLVDDEDRFNRKFSSVMYCIIVFLVICLAGTGHWWVWAYLAGILLQSTTITPWGIRLMAGFDRCLSYKLTGKEVEFNG